MAVGQFPKTPLRHLFTAASVDTLNLLGKCLTYEPRRRISAKEVRSSSCSVQSSIADPLTKALYHPYFTALPYPSHPSKLPKPASHNSRPLEEVDANVDLDAPGPSVKAAPPNRLKRKFSSPDSVSSGRSIARRLDFTQSKPQ
jgi:cyclin-dependent kinase 7